MRSIIVLQKKAVRFWVNNQPALLFLFMVTALFIFISSLPYFNIYLSPGITALILWCMAVFLLHLKSSTSVYAAVVGLMIMALSMILNNEKITNSAAEFGYYLFVIIFLHKIFVSKYE